MITHLTALFQGVLIPLHVNKTIHDVVPEDDVDVQILENGLTMLSIISPDHNLRAFFCNSRIFLQPEDSRYSNPYLMWMWKREWYTTIKYFRVTRPLSNLIRYRTFDSFLQNSFT
jgi:hypothetical protein